MSKDLGPETRRERQYAVRQAAKKAARQEAKREAQDVVDGLRAELDQNPK